MARTSSSLYASTRVSAAARTSGSGPWTASANQPCEFSPPGSSSRQAKPACAATSLSPSPLDPEPVLLDDVEQVDEALPRVRRRPGEHRVPGPLARARRSGWARTRCSGRPRPTRARLDEGAEPGEGLDREGGLGLLVEVAERGEGHVLPGRPVRAPSARALDPEAPEVDPARRPSSRCRGRPRRRRRGPRSGPEVSRTNGTPLSSSRARRAAVRSRDSAWLRRGTRSR